MSRTYVDMGLGRGVGSRLYAHAVTGSHHLGSRLQYIFETSLRVFSLFNAQSTSNMRQMRGLTTYDLVDTKDSTNVDTSVDVARAI